MTDVGLITGLLTLPLAPIRGTTWVAEQVRQEAERQYYDPSEIRRQLEEIDDSRELGRISDEEAEQMENELVERLMESGRRQAVGEDD